MQLVGVPDRQSDGGFSAFEHRLAGGVRHVVVHDGRLPGARDSPDQIAVQGQPPAQRAFAFSRLGLDNDFLGRIIEQRDSHVRVVEHLFQLLGNLR